MAKRLREEENIRHRNPGFIGKLTMSLCEAFNFATSALGFSSEIPSDRESMQSEVTYAQAEQVVSENKQLNESRNSPIFHGATNNRPKFHGNMTPIQQIRFLKGVSDEDIFLSSHLHSTLGNREEYENFGSPEASMSGRKTLTTHSKTIVDSSKGLYSPYKSFNPHSGESSIKVLTPRRDSSDSEIEILDNQQKIIYSEEAHSKLKDLVSKYNDKNNLLIESLLKRRKEVERRMARKILPDDQDKIIRQLYKDKDQSKIYVQIGGIDIKLEDIGRIAPGQWLNDEIINCYMNILNAECKNHMEYPRVHCFSTFFYVMLTNHGKGYNYNKVAKWTKSFDMFALDFVIAPIHVGGNHWCLAVINVRDKQFEYYDSMGNSGSKCLENLKIYLAEEHRTKKGSEIDLSDWKNYSPGNTVPQQNNIYDCGVFMCQFAESIASGSDIGHVNQADMPYYRKRMLLEILNNNRHFDDEKFASSRVY
jgi:sentrin-specific protease 1